MSGLGKVVVNLGSQLALSVAWEKSPVFAFSFHSKPHSLIGRQCGDIPVNTVRYVALCREAVPLDPGAAHSPPPILTHVLRPIFIPLECTLHMTFLF